MRGSMIALLLMGLSGGAIADPDSAKKPPPVKPSSQAEIAAKLNEEAKALIYAGKYSEASAKLREAVARVPEAPYFLNLGTSLYREGKFSEALTACNAGHKNNPSPAVAAKLDKMIAKIKDEAKAQGVKVQN